MSKTFEIQGHYNGKVILHCKAESLFDAVQKFKYGCHTEEYEIDKPSAIEVDEKTLREVNVR